MALVHDACHEIFTELQKISNKTVMSMCT